MSDLTEKLRIIANWDAKGDGKRKTDCVTWQAADLIEQQQHRIAELEDKRIRELNRKESELQGAFSRIDELSATVERLRDYIERGSPYSTNPSKCERNAILAATPQQNLAEHDAELIQRFLQQEAPLINPDGLDPDEHCCECILHDERMRLHNLAQRIKDGELCFLTELK